ncbi:hypothetical protein QTO34_007874 [Cnephaeus nilssonii]|uniref:Uncharacterized protein n=1 Tax=Cnephaeus nilssonii TaxID=3371016 RepID=A0AA40LHV1_CNENI|nr:hypothetical protein QTO34_007874 [Eptesicus nilssonii]
MHAEERRYGVTRRDECSCVFPAVLPSDCATGVSSYLEAFYSFCKNHGDVTAEIMCPILEVDTHPLSNVAYTARIPL